MNFTLFRQIDNINSAVIKTILYTLFGFSGFVFQSLLGCARTPRTLIEHYGNASAREPRACNAILFNPITGWVPEKGTRQTIPYKFTRYYRIRTFSLSLSPLLPERRYAFGTDPVFRAVFFLLFIIFVFQLLTPVPLSAKTVMYEARNNNIHYYIIVMRVIFRVRL